jgi:hypothetical protein
MAFLQDARTRWNARNEALCMKNTVCAGFPDARKGRRGNIAIADFGLSAFALGWSFCRPFWLDCA